MHWNPEQLTYQICIPPLHAKNICDFSHEEAEAYFLWYMEAVPQRVAYLSETCAAQLRCDRSALDLSPESLRLLWRWFLLAAKTEPAPQAAVSRTKKQLTLQTEYILRDIGMYLGEVFCARHKSLFWGHFETPKHDFFVNQAVIMGFEDRSYVPPFKMVFEPIHMAGVQAAKILHGQMKEEDLLQLYRHWEKYCIE